MRQAADCDTLTWVPGKPHRAAPYDLDMAIELQPTLRGDILTLRALRPDDFPALYAVAKDPLVWDQHPARDRYQESVFRAFFAEALESGGALIAIDAKDDHAIGSSRFHRYDEAIGEIEIGWSFLARAYWGGRYNQEMKRLMLNHAFSFANRVVFRVGSTNYRSQRAVEKIGGRRIGTGLGPDGSEHVIFEIARNP